MEPISSSSFQYLLNFRNRIQSKHQNNTIFLKSFKFSTFLEMPEYKLTYFDMKGRAEPMRILFALADVPYDDIRLSGEDFAKIKSTLPFGQMPLLEVDDIKLSQSGAIGRFLAKKFGFHGTNPIESAKIDEIVDAASDYGDGFNGVRTAKDDEAKAAAMKNFCEVATPKYFAKFSQILESNGGKYFVGKSLSWADLIIFNVITFFEAISEVELTKGYPTLKSFVKNVEAVPKIQRWIEKRPKTKF